MRAGVIGLVVVVLVALLFGGCVASGYNGLVRQKAEVDLRWQEVDNQLQRRNDLIGNLVETVKGAAGQEQQVFGDIAQARAAMSGASSRTDKIAAAQGMDGALSRLLVVVENYPQLRSMESFTSLMDEVSGTENRISVARGRYNEGVKEYNVAVRSFPMNLLAGAFQFTPAEGYPVPESSKAVPKVDFGSLRGGSSN